MFLINFPTMPIADRLAFHILDQLCSEESKKMLY